MRRCRIRVSFLWMASIAIAVIQPLAAEDAAPYRGKVFLGIGGEHVPLPEDERYASKFGIKLGRVPVGSTADAAGLRTGDILVSLDGAVWESEKIRLSRSFGKAGAKAMPGQMVNLLVLKHDSEDPEAPPQLESIDIGVSAYPRTSPEPGGTPTNDEIRPDLADHSSVYEKLSRRLLEKMSYKEDWLDLVARIDRTQQVPDPQRLPIVRYTHRDAYHLEVVTREVLDAVGEKPKRGAADAAFWVDHGRAVLRGFGRTQAAIEFNPPAADYRGGDLDAHLDYATAVLEAAAEANRNAFGEFDDEQISAIRDDRIALLDAFVELKMLSYDDDRPRQERCVRLLDLAGKIESEALFLQARLTALLVHPDFTSSLKAAAAQGDADLAGGVVAERDTPHGKIIVAGTGRNRHSADAAAIYDLGGDDVYANRQAASSYGKVPSAVIVDFDGNDAYETHEPFAQGCGDMGVGMLVDLEGDDSYIGVRYAQGTSFFGVGLLIDEQGDDTYRAVDLSQGVGQFGIGVLADRSGHDRYAAQHASQALGLPDGYGIVYDGDDGDDHYYCKGSKPSGYGTAGVFSGWGQGLGIGYRPYASGGVGLLFDAGGEDRVEGGNFTQGGGYYYGLGIIYGGGDGDDTYIGSRWAQGWSAHQAAGVMIEAGGNDRYTTRYAVVTGIAWDEAVSLFIEESGDDRYEGGGFSQGAASMNGWSIFLEMSGRDTYLYTDQALANSNDYHGGTSLAFFIDAGGDQDAYPSRPNNRIIGGGQRSIFIDLPGAIEDALNDTVIDTLWKRP